MITIISTFCLAFLLGSLMTLLLHDSGTKGISKHEYTTKDGVSHTAKRERGDHIV